MAAQSLLETHSPSRPRPATTTMRGLGHEHDFLPLRVEGHLPADLRDTLFRNGPARCASLIRPASMLINKPPVLGAADDEIIALSRKEHGAPR